MKTKKLTVILNLLGLISLIASCSFIVLSFYGFMIILNRGYITDDAIMKALIFMILAFAFLLIAFISFTAEIYKSLSELEKEIYEQRKN